MRQVRIGDITIDAGGRTGGSLAARPQDFFPAYDDATVQAPSAGNGARGVRPRRSV